MKTIKINPIQEHLICRANDEISDAGIAFAEENSDLSYEEMIQVRAHYFKRQEYLNMMIIDEAIAHKVACAR